MPPAAAAAVQVFVGPFLKRQDRPGANKDAMYTNVYIKNLDNGTTDEDFVELVGKFGPYSSAVIQKVGARAGVLRLLAGVRVPGAVLARGCRGAGAFGSRRRQQA
jgi:hypothetical protein